MNNINNTIFNRLFALGAGILLFSNVIENE